MIFGGIQKCSTIDFPGHLSCVLFTRGCNMDCFYCHNRALLISGGPALCTQEVEDFLKRRQGLLDGVVVSGGEPTLQADLPAFLHDLKKLGYRTKLDTNGQSPEIVRELQAERLLDYVAVDYKAPCDEYGWVCGCEDGFAKAKQAIIQLFEAGAAFEARTTLYPGLQEEELLNLLRDLPALPRYRLNLFRMPAEFRPHHALLLRRACLTAADLTRLQPQLTAVQPNIVW